MANCCEVNFKIVGEKKHIEFMLRSLQQEKGIFVGRGMSMYETPNYEDLGDGKFACEGFGDVKWSIRSALFDNAISMRENPSMWYFGEDVDVNKIQFVTLAEASKLFNVDVEMYSTEPWCCFAEHYLIKDGEIIIDEQVPYFEMYHEYLTDETIAEIEEGLGRKLLEDEIGGNDDYIIIGGYGEYGWEI